MAGNSTTEDDILNDLGEEITGDVNAEHVSEHDDIDEDIINEPTPDETPFELADEIASENGAPKADNSKGNNGTGGEVDKGKQAAGPQDLVDKDGNVIARAGAERRHYENLQRERAKSQELEGQLASIQRENEVYKQTVNIGKELGISNEEVISGARIIAAYKTDPIGTLKHMLTQAKAAGYNVDELGGSALDMSAVRQMINEAMSPITEQTERSRIESENAAAAEREYNTFITTFPDARVHEGTIARLLKEQPSLCVEAAYYKLQAFYASRGLDWTKSLETLEAAANNAPKETSRPTPPSGGRSNAELMDTTEPVGANQTFDDIIRASMSEAGYN